MTIKRGKIQILSDFMEGLNTAIDASSQMIHQRNNIKFMAMRDILNMIKDDLGRIVTKGMSDHG